MRDLLHSAGGRAGRQFAGLLAPVQMASTALAVLALGTPALGAEPERDALTLGTELLEQERYDEARVALERAVSENPDDGAALLLLGMAELGLGLSDEAIARFERARRVRPDLEQIALYDMGLAYSQAGRREKARKAFEQAIAVDEKSRLAANARELLEVFGPRDKPWRLAARMGVEFDDNVTVSEVDVTSGQSDVAFVAEASGSYRFTPAESYGMELGYDFYQSLYDELSDANFQAHGLWMEGTRAGGLFDSALRYRFTTSTLGGDRFLDVHELAPRAALRPRSWWLSEPTVGWAYRDFSDDSERDAHRAIAGVDNVLFLPERSAFATTGYRFEAENAQAARFDWLGFSTRSGVHLPFDFAWGKNAFDVSYRFRLRSYTSETPSIGKDRLDHVHTVGLALTRDIGRYLDARLDYRFIGSVSNLPSADFLENILTFSVGIYL